MGSGQAAWHWAEATLKAARRRRRQALSTGISADGLARMMAPSRRRCGGGGGGGCCCGGSCGGGCSGAGGWRRSRCQEVCFRDNSRPGQATAARRCWRNVGTLWLEDNCHDLVIGQSLATNRPAATAARSLKFLLCIHHPERLFIRCSDAPPQFCCTAGVMSLTV